MSGPGGPTRKRRAELSQHFLRPGPAARLVQATSITAADLVIEVGPGRGALTKPLSRRSARVIGVELDGYLARKLRASELAVDVVHQDFLRYPLPTSPYTVVGNLPYAQSMAIIQKLNDAAVKADDIWVVVQREFAERLCGLPYRRESLVSLTLKPWWHIEIADRLRRVDFDPPPSVESAFLHLQNRKRCLVPEAKLARYVALLGDAFRSNPGVVVFARRLIGKRQARKLADELCFPPESQPGELSFEQWLGVFRALCER